MALASRSLHEIANLDLSIDTRYPDGSKPFVQPATLGIDQAAFNNAGITLNGRTQNTPIAINYRTYLTGTSATTATLSVNAIAGTLGNWSIDGTGNNLANPATVVGSGSLQVTATDGVTTVTFPVQVWSIIASTGLKKIWRPGHAADFNTVLLSGDTISKIKPELDAIKPYPNVLGYQPNFTWSSLEPVQGETDTSALYPNGYATGAALIKSIYDYLANMSPPRDLMVKLNVGAFTKTHPGSTDYSIIPQYIQTNSTYGNAGYRVGGVLTNVPGQHGWWGGDGNGNTYGACLHRAAVMNRIIKLVQTLGAYFDGLPYFYGWNLDENSFIIGTSTANGNPDASNGAFDTQYRAYVSQCVGTFVHSHFLFENSFAGTSNLSQSFMDFQMANGVVQSNTDVLGYSRYNPNPYTWGMNAFCGNIVSGMTGPATNYRDQGYPCMPEVQATDMGAYGQFGGGYSKEDILKELNTVIKASRVWWTVLTGSATSYGNIQPNSTWVDLGPFLNNPANALTNTAYPSIAKGYT